MTTSLIIDLAEFRHGVVCADCDRSFEHREAYSQKLVGMAPGGWCETGGCEARPIVEIVCVPCGLGTQVAP